ncbi:MAG: DUF4294 domain-containing protein [Bacteroidota bacterium]
MSPLIRPYIRHHLLGFCLLLMGWQLAQSQTRDSLEKRFRVYSYEGETYMVGALEDVDITAKKPTKRQLRRGKKRLAKFTRLRWNVHKVYPYAVKVAEVMQEVEAHVASLPTEDARKTYLKSKEATLFGSYEDDLKRMTRSQGKMLVKLVYRETGNSTFELIKETKSGASAVFWQSIGLIFGINLKDAFDADKDEEDAMINQIVRELEYGGYNIAYRQYNYQLE